MLHVVQLPVPSKVFLPVLGKRLCPFGEDVFLAMLPHTASQKYLFDWRHVSFPESTPSVSPLQGLQPWQFPKNTDSKEEPLLTTPLYGELHLHTFRRICLRSSERRKSEWSSIGPAFVELRALTRTPKAWKTPTHTSGSRRPSFSVLMLRPQELWS